MYNAQTTKNRIKSLCKSKKINIESLLTKCGLGINAIQQINDKKGMASYSLARIADELNCSVDYLLGRTDIPEQVCDFTGDSNAINNTLSQNYGTQIAGSSVPVLSSPSKECAELMHIYTTLPFRQQVRLLSIAVELEQES